MENFHLQYDLVPGPFEEVMFKKGKKKQLIGSIYNILLKEESKHYSMHKLYEQWNKDLQFKEANIKWKKCLYLTNKITTNENLRLIQYKLMTRIYYTRDKLHKFYADSSDQCVKCGSQDSLIHAFWHCMKVNKGWNEIQDWISTICKTKMQFSVQLCIFQNPEGVRYPMGWLIMFSSLVYKKLILKYWKDAEAPTLKNWKELMKYYLTIENTLSEDNNKTKQFNEVWKHIYEAL